MGEALDFNYIYFQDIIVNTVYQIKLKKDVPR